MLPDAMNTRNGLQLNRRVDQRLAQKNVSGIDEVEAGRLCFSVQEEAFDLYRVSYIPRNSLRNDDHPLAARS